MLLASYITFLLSSLNKHREVHPAPLCSGKAVQVPEMCLLLLEQSGCVEGMTVKWFSCRDTIVQ